MKADCSLPKNFKAPIDTTDRDHFLRGTNPPPLAPSRRIIQSSMTDFIRRDSIPPSHLHTSSSTSNVIRAPPGTLVRSRSLIALAQPNLFRNKCIARTNCNHCPLLNTSGTITCHVTKKVFLCKTNITCRSTNLIYCISCKTCGKQYVGQTKRTILERFQGHFNKINTCQTGRREDPILFLRLEKDAVGTHFSADNHHGTKDLNISVMAYISTPPDSLRSLEYRLQVEKNVSTY